MRNVLFTLLITSGGCATLATPGNHAWLRVWDSGVAYGQFGGGDLVEYRSDGACKLRYEPVTQPHYRAPHAGEIRVTGSSPEPVVLPVDYVGAYRDGPRRQEPLWKGGEPVTIEAPGKHAPPFRIELKAPAPIEVIEPARENIVDVTYHDLHISMLKDLTVRWRGGDGGPVRAEISNNGRYLTCDFDGKAGTGTIPQRLLAELPAGPSFMAVAPFQNDTIHPGGWNLSVAIYTMGMTQKVILDTDNPKGTW